MATRTQQRQGRASEQGSMALLGALAMVVLAGMATLAVDYGFLEYKRSQLQNAADAAALAGANVLLQYGGNRAAVTNVAVAYGQRNLGDEDGKDLAIRDSDVAYPDISSVQTTVGRTSDRGNAIEMFLGRILGWNTQDITAQSRAALFCSNTTRCLKPWSPPAKFTWNDRCGTAKYQNNGQLDADNVCEMQSVEVQGYGPSDVGTQIVLKIGDPSGTVTPGHYQPVDYPAVNRGNPKSGGDEYRTNIAGCAGSNNTGIAVNDQLAIEPGNMVGPTKQGLEALIALDPNATWDTSTNAIRNSARNDPMTSPRVALIPFYDPRYPQQSGRNTVTVYQLGAVFIESLNANGDVTGRFIKTMAVDPVRQTGCDPNTAYTLYGAGLVQ